jgi:hypothetical protein
MDRVVDSDAGVRCGQGVPEEGTWQPVGEALAVSDLASPQTRRRRRRREAVHSRSSVNGDGSLTGGLQR